MKIENVIVRVFWCLESWGSCLQTGWENQNSTTTRKEKLAYMSSVVAAVVVVITLLVFYSILNRKTDWAHFIIFLVVDAGVSFLGMVVVLLRPVQISILGSTRLLSNRSIGNGDEEREHTDREETRHLLSTQITNNEDIAAPPTQIFRRIPFYDTAITIHFTVTCLSIISSIISDNLVTIKEADMNYGVYVLFLYADVVEDFLYCIAFGGLAVSFRLLAIRIWNLKEDIDKMFSSPGSLFSLREAHFLNNDNAINDRLSSMLNLLQSMRIQYEATFQAAECISHRMGAIVLALVALVAVELAATLKDVFHDESLFENMLTLQHLAMLRLILVLAALILQLVLSAADLYYASERFSECMSQIESKIRIDLATMSYQRTLETTSSNHQTLRCYCATAISPRLQIFSKHLDIA